MNILITGAAGFIGAALAIRLCQGGHRVVGVDNINDYYDVGLKHGRLSLVTVEPNFSFHQVDISDLAGLTAVFAEVPFDLVINLAAQAGVRYSIDNPHAYSRSNLVGFLNVLECCRTFEIKHLIYASSSSVYGERGEGPFSTDANVDHPVSLYAATKKSNELMAHAYSHLYGIQTIGLRFFTVYGPWGRPDMALFKFTRAICKDEPIDVYNKGELWRDFTYIDDVVEGVARLVATCEVNALAEPYVVYNIGRGEPQKLTEFISAIEHAIGKQARLNMLPHQAGDVTRTWADTAPLERVTGFTPQVSLSDGVRQFVTWYIDYYGITL